MKSLSLLILLSVTIAAASQNGTPDTVPVMNNEMDSMSYFLGLSLGYDIKTLPFDSDMDLIIAGFSGAFRGTAYHDEQSTKFYFMQLQQAFQQKEEEKASLVAQQNLENGNRFLLENGSREGVFTTESGLQYEVLVKGEGLMPADSSEVKVHYEGTLVDGTVFDSSYERGEPVSFPLNRVISGWTEGVQLMPVGSTYKFYIPADLGYGSRESGPIPANSVLIFKIELLGFE